MKIRRQCFLLSLLLLLSCEVPELTQTVPSTLKNFSEPALVTDQDFSWDESCVESEFTQVRSRHLLAISQDSIALANFERYRYLNHQIALLGLEDAYFGPDSKYTRHVAKLVRNLEFFWGMTGQVKVSGQHGATLDDPYKLHEVLKHVIADMEDAELSQAVQEYLKLNARSNQLPENPLLSMEAFATADGKIVVGDGLVSLFSEAGIAQETAWDGILAHEWAHQVQYQMLSNSTPWPMQKMVELEADFFSGYFLTHKRGGTYNWKDIRAFLNLSFTAGDCSLLAGHGTPQERMVSAQAGSQLAVMAQKKGIILEPETVRIHFLEHHERQTDL